MAPREAICPKSLIAQCTSRWAMARGHRLNTSIVLEAVHDLSRLFRAVSAVEPSLSRPLPTLSPSLIGHLASVDVKQHERKKVGHHVYLARPRESIIVPHNPQGAREKKPPPPPPPLSVMDHWRLSHRHSSHHTW